MDCYRSTGFIFALLLVICHVSEQVPLPVPESKPEPEAVPAEGRSLLLDDGFPSGYPAGYAPIIQSNRQPLISGVVMGGLSNPLASNGLMESQNINVIARQPMNPGIGQQYIPSSYYPSRPSFSPMLSRTPQSLISTDIMTDKMAIQAPSLLVPMQVPSYASNYQECGPKNIYDNVFNSAKYPAVYK